MKNLLKMSQKVNLILIQILNQTLMMIQSLMVIMLLEGMTLEVIILEEMVTLEVVTLK
jgi:hypothetical protein